MFLHLQVSGRPQILSPRVLDVNCKCNLARQKFLATNPGRGDFHSIVSVVDELPFNRARDTGPSLLCLTMHNRSKEHTHTHLDLSCLPQTAEAKENCGQDLTKSGGKCKIL